ncbi:MAG: GrpB family protein [Thermoleophilaceae bacterium]
MERHPSLDDRCDPAIRIMGADCAWPAQADAEMRRIRDELGDIAVRVDHVGSTAVPALAAKPIIDLQLSVPRIGSLPQYRDPLERLGYLFVPDPESPDFHLFALPTERPRTHHLHVCESGSEHERRHLAVRDFLRAHPVEAARYEALKRELADRHRTPFGYVGASAEAPARQWLGGGVDGIVRGLTLNNVKGQTPTPAMPSGILQDGFFDVSYQPPQIPWTSLRRTGSPTSKARPPSWPPSKPARSHRVQLRNDLFAEESYLFDQVG